MYYSGHMWSLFRPGSGKEKARFLFEILSSENCIISFFVNAHVLTNYKYYIYTKEPMPMDIDFLVHDTCSMVRPQWVVAADLEEATRIFGEAVAYNYKLQDSEKSVVEPEEDEAESVSSDDGLDDDAVPDVEQEQESDDEDEVSFFSLAGGVKTGNILTGISRRRLIHPPSSKMVIIMVT